MMDLNEQAESLSSEAEIDDFREELGKKRSDLVDRIQMAFDANELDLALEIQIGRRAF